MFNVMRHITMFAAGLAALLAHSRLANAENWDSKPAAKAEAVATQEIDKLRSTIDDQAARVKSFYGEVEGLSDTFRSQTDDLRAALEAYRRGPRGRRQLQEAAANSLTTIARRADELLARRGETLAGVLEVEQAARKRASGRREEAENLDADMTTQQAEVARTRAENERLKALLENDPSNRELRRQLRRRYYAERRAAAAAEGALRKGESLWKASSSLERSADNLLDLHDALEASMDEVAMLRDDVRQTADLLTDLAEIEAETSVFTGGLPFEEVFLELGELSGVANGLRDTISELSLEVCAAPDEGKRAETPSESGFEAWLGERRGE